MYPNCTDWENEDNNGPCAVAEHICDGDSTCPCSNLLYILNASCNFCLNQTIPSWSDYSQSQSCSAQAPDPTPLPDSTAKDAVPAWALTMASETPTPSQFNVTAAMDLAQGNDTTGANPPSSSTSSGSSSTGSTTPSSTFLSSPSSSVAPLLAASSSSKLNAGTIAGAVIGVLVALALVALAVWYFVRRRRRHTHMAPSAAYKEALRNGTATGYTSVPLQDEKSSHPRLDHPQQTDFSSEFSDAVPAWMNDSRPASVHSESRFLEHTY
ncbi:hypothetical protein HMN09_00094800 [Mycena chlorophos]|uniref:Extracellular membrane protein CFEM domain-containing protein n=1 Tax=Mycena chlorophos TaxID=658473 RepID=A0A8H6TSY6_MYCCL|nr:hypothetical protein HMN09_00094800 [Mycena chlorophos]